MTESVAQEGGIELTKHWIVAGAAFAAALAGAGITAAIDYPWHADAAMPSRARPAVVAAVATLPAVAVPPAVQPHAAPAPVGKASAARHSPARIAVRHAAPSGVPSAPARDVDAQYHRLVAAECGHGLQGVWCREAVRWRLCRGRWTTAGAAGASCCRVGEIANR